MAIQWLLFCFFQERTRKKSNFRKIIKIEKKWKKVFEIYPLYGIITNRLWTGCINLSWYNYQTLRRYKTNGKQMGIFV